MFSHLQKSILWTNYHNFPLVYIVIIYQTSWKALHWVLVELWQEKEKFSFPKTYAYKGKQRKSNDKPQEPISSGNVLVQLQQFH